MDWIRVETGLPDHPKVGRLARRLKVDKDRALAIVVRLLCWVGRMKERGELNGTDPEDLAEVCRWEGEPDQLLTALRGAGWIDSTEAGDVVHDWMERQGSVFKTRERVARSADRYANATRSLREGYAKPTDLQTDRQTKRRACERARALSRRGGSARSPLQGMGAATVKHITDQTSRADLERLRDAGSRLEEGRYTCLACMDSGLLYVQREPYGRPALGVVPCTECTLGGKKHLDGDYCTWAKGIHPCPLCGAHEGEKVPIGWTPEPPEGWVPYHELPGWFSRNIA